MSLWDTIAPYGSLIAFAANIVFALFMLVMGKNFVSKNEFREAITDIENLQERCKDHDHEIALIQRSFENHPTKEDFYQLSLQMTQLKQEIAVAGAHFEGMKTISKRLETQVGIIDGYLRDQPR